MMRYQKVSPDVLLLSNGKKLSLRTCKEEDAIPDYVASVGKSLPRAQSASGSADPSPTSDCHHSFPSEPLLAQCNQQPSSTKAQNNHHRFEVNGFGADVGGGTGLLQWGQNKRSRGSRADDRSAGDESSANSRQKIRRRSVLSAAMPPPPCSLYTRDANHRSLKNKNIKEGSSDLTLSGKTSPRVLPENAQKPMAKAAQNGCAAAAAAAGVYVNTESSKRPFEREMGSAGEKINLDKFEWPRIYISLSRKEKEDDFLAMKGTKLPHRPKKRPKNIEKALQYCFPGMWLSDLTRARYEVREKKCVKKKKLGLRAMESSNNSDSE